MTRALVLFTTNHPFTYTGGETMFVGPEVTHLLHAFQSLRVVPLHDTGRVLSLPAGVVLDRSLAANWRRHRLRHTLSAPLWPGFWLEFWRGVWRGGWVGAARVWRWAAVACATWAWLNAQLSKEGPALLYTYWRGGQTLASARWAKCHAGSVAVTRVHRYELYDEAFSPPFQPWVNVYHDLARVIAIAQQGADYLRAHGVAGVKLRVARLGVAASPCLAAGSVDGVWRIVSCSYVTLVKRVERVSLALATLARRHPQRRIEWTHFGDGPAMPSLRVAARLQPENLLMTLPGWVSNDRVLKHYRTLPVDLLVLLSASEGLPVTIQEALAHGIPVMATDVGGVAEAVPASGDNGALLQADASIEAIVDVLERLLLAPPDAIAARRDAAFQHWQRNFDADRNHAALAAELASIEQT